MYEDICKANKNQLPELTEAYFLQQEWISDFKDKKMEEVHKNDEFYCFCCLFARSVIYSFLHQLIMSLKIPDCNNTLRDKGMFRKSVDLMMISLLHTPKTKKTNSLIPNRKCFGINSARAQIVIGKR